MFCSQTFDNHYWSKLLGQRFFFLSCFYIFYQWALLIFKEWFSLNFSMATSFEVVNASWHTVLSMKIKYNTVSSHWLHLYVPIRKIFFSTFRNISSSETAHFLYKIVIICCFTTLEVLLLINSLWGENKSSQMLRADKQPPPLYVMICLTLPQTLTRKGKLQGKMFFEFLMCCGWALETFYYDL